MLALYRRHLAGCKFTSRKQRACRCPIWAEGKVHGHQIRQSLDLSNWEAAVRLTREWEIHAPLKTVPIAEACDRFVADAKARKLSEGSVLKYEQAVKSLKSFGDKTVRQVSVDDIGKLRESWKISALTMQKRLETIRAFFKFCVRRDWTDKNPAEHVTAPVVNQNPTLPFSDDDMAKIFEALETQYLAAHPFSSDLTKRKIKAFILVMLNSGIRISDCVFLRKERIQNGTLFLYTQKTKVPVRIPLPPNVLEALEAIGATDYYFSTGSGKVKTWTTEWEERLKKVFVLAGFPDAHSHMLRDTFAVNLLLKEVPIEVVAGLLGNTVAVCQKHYSPWVQTRQKQAEEAVRRTWA
jgi:integrase